MATDAEYPDDLSLTSSSLAWQTTVPGTGHSSPIITEDLVVLTTAYSSPQYKMMLALCGSVVSIGCMLLALVVGLCLSRDVSSIVLQGNGKVLPWARGVLVCFSGLVLLAQLQLGQQIFDYARCPIRSWLGPHLAITFGMTIALILSLDRGFVRRANSVILFLLGAATLVLVPAKDHVYRQGVFGAQSLVVMTCALIPIALLSGVLALHFWMSRSDRKSKTFCPPTLTVLTGAVLCMLICIARVTRTSHVEHLLTDDEVRPFFPDYLLFPLGIATSTLGVATVFVQWLMHQKTLQHPFGERLLVFGRLLSVVGIMILMIALISNELLRQSSFLQYHLPSPNWSTLPLAAFATSTAIMIATGIVGILTSRLIEKRSNWLGPGATALILLLYPMHLIEANGVHQEPHLKRAVVALDRKTGTIRWVWEGFASPREIVHRENSQATPTAVAANGRLMAWFGSAGLVCLDLSTGRELWSRADVKYESIYGAGASPVATNDCLVIVTDAPRKAKILGIQISTGRTMWEQDRADLMKGIYADSGHSHTPLITTAGIRHVAWVTGWDRVTGYDCANGTILLNEALKGGGDRVASPASDERHVYWGSPRELVATGKSSLSQGRFRVIWRVRADSNCVSPISNGQQVFTCTDRGIMQCLDATSGKPIWRDRLPGEFRSSPLIAGGLLYLGQLEGLFYVLDTTDPNHKWRKFQFPAPIFATSAAADGQLIVRTESTVYCFSRPVAKLTEF